MPQQIAVLPDPVIGVLAAVALLVVAVVTARWLSLKGRPVVDSPARTLVLGATFVLVWISLGVRIADLPDRIPGMLAVVSIAGLLAWFVFFLSYRLTMVWYVGWWIPRTLRQRETAIQAEVYGQSLPKELRSRDEQLQALGFEPVTTIASDDVLAALWFRPTDSVIAEIASLPKRRKLPTILELTSSFGSATAVLSTSTLYDPGVLWVWDVWGGELRQTFPASSLEDLVAEHQRALGFVAERGLRHDDMSQDQVSAVREQCGRRQAAAVCDASRKAIAAVLGRPPAAAFHVGRLEEQPDIAERLEAFRQLASGGSGSPT